MRNSDLDQMVEFAVERLAQGNCKGTRSLVREIAVAWPNAPALGIVFALTTAAATIEDVIDTPTSIQSAQVGYKLAALVSADIFALEAMGYCPATGQDLLHFWRRVDPFFLKI